MPTINSLMLAHRLCNGAQQDITVIADGLKEINSAYPDIKFNVNSILQMYISTFYSLFVKQTLSYLATSY